MDNYDERQAEAISKLEMLHRIQAVVPGPKAQIIRRLQELKKPFVVAFGKGDKDNEIVDNDESLNSEAAEKSEAEKILPESSSSQNLVEDTQDSDDDDKACEDFFGPSPLKRKKKDVGEVELNVNQRIVHGRSMRPRCGCTFNNKK